MTPSKLRGFIAKKHKNSVGEDKLMTRKELARYFKVSPDAIDHYAKKKDIPAFRIEVDTKNGGGIQLMNHHWLSAFSAWKPLRYKNSEWWRD